VQPLDERESAAGETILHLLSLVSASPSQVANFELPAHAIGEEKMCVQLYPHLDPISLCALASPDERPLLLQEQNQNQLEQKLVHRQRGDA
jgi:hypothetical protein